MIVSQNDKMVNVEVQFTDDGKMVLTIGLEQHGEFSSGKPRAATTAGNRQILDGNGNSVGWFGLNVGLS